MAKNSSLIDDKIYLAFTEEKIRRFWYTIGLKTSKTRKYFYKNDIFIANFKYDFQQNLNSV